MVCSRTYNRLQLRKHTYYVRVVLPKDIQKLVNRKQLCYTLHTKNYYEALRLVRKESYKIDLLIACLRKLKMKLENGTIILSEAEIRQFLVYRMREIDHFFSWQDVDMLDMMFEELPVFNKTDTEAIQKHFWNGEKEKTEDKEKIEKREMKIQTLFESYISSLQERKDCKVSTRRLIEEIFNTDCKLLNTERVMPELAMNSEKPSKALTALAFNEAFRPKDYQRLVEASKKASSTELKEFLTQEVDHEPKEKVINYLSFPMLAMMTQHLKPWEATDIFLIEPNLIKDCIPEIRSKTFKELMNESTYLLLQRKAPKELQEDLKITDKTPNGCCGTMSFINEDSFKGEIVTRLDTRILDAGSHWINVRKARVSTHQTGTAVKIQQWYQNFIGS